MHCQAFVLCGGIKTKKMEEIIKRRHEIVIAYCEKMEWEANPETLTLEQIMEIRKQKDWIDVPKLVSEGK